MVSGPRRIAACHPDRDDAARGLRARRVAPARRHARSDEATASFYEPIEEVVIDVDEEYSGIVVQKMSERKAEMIEMRPPAETASASSSMRRRAASSAIRASF